MFLKDLTLKTPQENILYDEVLLHLAEQGRGGEVLRFWESPDIFVVLGKICKEQEDIKIDAVLKDNIPVLRRSSGGGTVLQGQGCLNYALVLSKARDPQIADLRKSYQYILGKVILALKQFDVEAVFCPISDIALAHSLKKISGNAQKRSKQFILHHGTMLYDFDLQSIEKYLKIPNETPEYRQRRPHADFVANVSFNTGAMKNNLKKIFKVTAEESYLNAAEQECLQSFLTTKAMSVHLASVR